MLFALVYDDPGFTGDDLRRAIDEAWSMLDEPPSSVASHEDWLGMTWEDPGLIVQFRWTADDAVVSMVRRGLAREGVAVDPTRPASRALLGTTTGGLEAADHINFLIVLSDLLDQHPALATSLGDPAGPADSGTGAADSDDG